MFTAILLNKNDDGTTTAQLTQLDDAQLPADGDVTVRVDYSTMNYKDGLAITGKAPVVRSWPMVPGIDGAGEVIASSHPDWKAGDAFILNGWGVGESHWGCLSQRAKLKGGWLIPRPPGMSARTAMAIGTAGYTAMLCAMALQEQGVDKNSGDILVTGASGGVGSIAIAILAGWGYRVVASTGKLAEADYLTSLGAVEVIDRAAVRSRQAAAEGTLGRGRRFRRLAHAGQCGRTDPLWRHRHGMRAGPGDGFSGVRCAIHPAQRQADRHRQRDGPPAETGGGMGAAGERTGRQ
jgi:acrylyl-CoA reductase (NADPH)